MDWLNEIAIISSMFIIRLVVPLTLTLVLGSSLKWLETRRAA